MNKNAEYDFNCAAGRLLNNFENFLYWHKKGEVSKAAKCLRNISRDEKVYKNFIGKEK